MKKVGVSNLDFLKAFVFIKQIFTKIKHEGIVFSTNSFDMIEKLLSTIQQKTIVRLVVLFQGVPQGRVLGPLVHQMVLAQNKYLSKIVKKQLNDYL